MLDLNDLTVANWLVTLLMLSVTSYLAGRHHEKRRMRETIEAVLEDLAEEHEEPGRW